MSSATNGGISPSGVCDQASVSRPAAYAPAEAGVSEPALTKLNSRTRAALNLTSTVCRRLTAIVLEVLRSTSEWRLIVRGSLRQNGDVIGVLRVQVMAQGRRGPERLASTQAAAQLVNAAPW